MANYFAPLLILVVAVSGLSLLLVKPANAESTPGPSVPQFIMRFEDDSYDIPPVYSTDPYTNQTVLVQEGFHFQNDSIIVTIKNQPFTPYRDANSNQIQLYYNLSYKGYYGNDWNFFFGYLASNSDYTVVFLGVGGNNATNSYNNVGELGGQVDIRIQAFIGYSTTIEGSPDPLFHRPTYQTFYTGQTSDWSATQTITIPASSTSLSPSVPELTYCTLLIVVIFGITTAIASVFKKGGNLLYR